MTEKQLLSQLKFRIANLQSSLGEKQKVIEEYKYIESQADSKIKGMQKIHSQKIKSLLNSIQLLKKQKASIQGLSKQHKRSKLIQQLNKQINDQDLVIQILRKNIYQQHGKQNGRKMCDQIIVKALNKGPDRIRPLAREELRMEIEKLKDVNLGLERKMKQGDKKGGNIGKQLEADETISVASSEMSSMQESMLGENKTEEMLSRMRSLQLQLQTMKIESSSKTKIIQRLKSSILQQQKYKSQTQLLKNQLQISNRKLFSFQKLLRENKQSTNKKIIDLYERELKVEELQMIGNQNTDKLNSLSSNHNIMLQELQAEKEQLQVMYDELKQQNERIILQNVSNKKHQETQKGKIDEIRLLNQKQKQNLSQKLNQYENEVQRVLNQNSQLQKRLTQLETKFFQQRATWIEEKHDMIEELQQLRGNKAQSQQVTQLLTEVDRLRDENKRLQEIFATGGNSQGASHDKLLLQRLQAYKRKCEYLQNSLSKGQKSKQIQIYNQLFAKYNKLIQQFEEYKSNNIGGRKKQQQRKQHIAMTLKEKQYYDDLSSGMDQLNLAEVDSQILDNFNTSYDYSIEINQDGYKKKAPKISEADKELLKLINSDLWCFIKDDQLDKKLEQVAQVDNDTPQIEDIQKLKMIRHLKNLSHPQGHKITLYEEELAELQKISDSVSVTSAMINKINDYDSDINLEVEKLNYQHMPHPHNINLSKFKDISSSISSFGQQISSLDSNDSLLKKKKRQLLVPKATALKFATNKEKIQSQISESSISQDLMNSDVSSVNINERELNRIDSDVETDFRKKKPKK